ncbi:MAG: glycosyltransferase family 2 protein [Nitrospinae bacterium]|nr:glycosyltransferase family 2 protein [Nitrospinota bacterium]
MEKTDISVIIPTFNRPELLEKTLSLYNAQTCNNYEVIVVDDGSPEDTEAVVKLLQGEVLYRLKYLRQEKSGPAAARNKGIKIAEGDILLFTGDDIFPKANLLERHLAAIRKHPAFAVLGRVEWSEDGNVTDFMRHIAPDGFQFRYGGIKDKMNCGFRHFYTSNISLSKTWFFGDAFDEDFPFGALEDTELAYRLEKKGLKILLEEQAVGYHQHFTTLESFKQRMKRVGISAVLLLEKHPELTHIFLPVDFRIVKIVALSLRVAPIFKNIRKDFFWQAQIVRSYIEGVEEGMKRKRDTLSHF